MQCYYKLRRYTPLSTSLNPVISIISHEIVVLTTEVVNKNEIYCYTHDITELEPLFE